MKSPLTLHNSQNWIRCKAEVEFFTSPFSEFQMKLWEFFIKHDTDLDLSSTKTVREWVQGLELEESGRLDARSLMPNLGAMAECQADEIDAAEWLQNCHALRKIVARITDVKTRDAKISDEKADQIMLGFIARMSPQLIIWERPIRTIWGCRYLASNLPPKGFPRLASAFWQIMFGDLTIASFSGVCGRCYRDLGFLASGKPCQGDYCRACLNKFAKERMPEEERKRKNREHQARYRERMREKKKGAGNGKKG